MRDNNNGEYLLASNLLDGKLKNYLPFSQLCSPLIVTACYCDPPNYDVSTTNSTDHDMIAFNSEYRPNWRKLTYLLVIMVIVRLVTFPDERHSNCNKYVIE